MLNSKLLYKKTVFLLGLLWLTGVCFVFVSCSTTYKDTVDTTKKTVSRDTRAFVGTKDILMLHSVTDLVGLNRITRKILRYYFEKEFRNT